MISPGLPEDWPEQVKIACSRFKQGHLVSSPPFFYAATAAHGIWDLTRDFGDPAVESEILELEGELEPPFGLITTQSCDIDEPGKPKKPWIRVCPVFDMTTEINQDSLGNLRKDKIVYLMLLDPPTLGEGLWVADFRLEFPLEKGWLVGKEPIESFSSKERYTVLAHRLAGLVGRPALGVGLGRIHDHLQNWWDEEQKRNSLAHDEVREVRIVITGGDLLSPTDAHFLILTDTTISDAGKTAWTEFWQEASEIAASNGINLAANSYETMDTLSARGYLDSIPLQLS